MKFKVRRDNERFILYYGFSFLLFFFSLVFFVFMFKYYFFGIFFLGFFFWGFIYSKQALPNVLKVGMLVNIDFIYATYFIMRKPKNNSEIAFYPFQNGGRGVPKRYYFLTESEINIKDIKEYGFYKDMNKTKDLVNQDNIIIVTKKNKRYNIPTPQFNRKDIIKMVNYIYEKTNIKPIGSLNDYIS